MTVAQMRQLCNKKPTDMSWNDFDNLELVALTETSIEYISEFGDGHGVVILECDCGECDGSKKVFGLMTEDCFETLYTPDGIDEITAQEELISFAIEDEEMGTNFN